jgi:ATP-dependent HslUV protease ATP-binding subunit HslU
MATEGVALSFTDDGLQRIAELAWEVNEKTENIGARRLHTMLEKLLELVSYEAASETSVTIDADYVNQQLGELSQDEDLSRYIL